MLVIYLRGERGASESDPLSREHLHVGRSVESDSEHIRGKQLSLQDVQLHVGRPEGDDLVEGVDQGGEDEVDPKGGGRSDPLQACDWSKVVTEASDWPIVRSHSSHWSNIKMEACDWLMFYHE